MRKRFRESLLLGGLVLIPCVLAAQVTTGTAEVSLRGADGKPRGAVTVVLSGAAGFRATVQTDANGEFAVVLPYGRYELSSEGALGPESSGVEVCIAPQQTTHVDLLVDASGAFQLVKQTAERVPGLWSDTTGERVYPEGFSLQSALL